MEVRRTKRMGGHLPSAAKSNTDAGPVPELPQRRPGHHRLGGRSPRRGPPRRRAGRAPGPRASSAAAGGGPRGCPGRSAPSCKRAELAGTRPARPRTANWTPAGRLARPRPAPPHREPCQVTFLDCFHCGNCLVTRDHLPRLLALLDALAQRRRELPEEAWWPRYGPAWVAIRQDILAKFTPAELQQAQARKPHDALLDLIENPWELP